MLQSMLSIYNEATPFLKTDLPTFEDRLGLRQGSNCFIEEIDKKPVGFTVINQNSILALCVIPEFQNKGIGKKLLRKAEAAILKQGYSNIVLGHTEQLYLCQGVPYQDDHKPYEFFQKFGYTANWSSIDMVMPLKDYTLDRLNVPEVSKGITFRYTSDKDEESLTTCVAQVNPSWSIYFKQNNSVYIAEENGLIIGFVIVAKGGCSYAMNFDGVVGEIGCLGVLPSYRSKGVGLRLAAHGTNELKKLGCDYAYLGYTWLEDWYGQLGYQTYARFWMGEKS